MGPRDQPTIGIITALPIECFAVQAVLDDVTPEKAPDAGDAATYFLGALPSSVPGRPHRVVLSLLPEDGGVAAAHGCANLQRSWRVPLIIMCGIACGVPSPEDPPRHVRLGDILVAEDGVVPYGHVRAMAGGKEELRRPAAKPSVVLKSAVGRLRVAEEAGQRAWERLLDVRGRPGLEEYARPPAVTDVLVDDRGTAIPHPPASRSGHVVGRPKVHYGRIGSGGKLINSAAERTRLARRYHLIGFDMEGDGVSDAAYFQRVEWFMVRGVSDYGSGKNDLWHRYASLAAAAYLHALLGQVDPVDRPARTQVRGKVLHIDADRYEAIVDALLHVRTMHDAAGRDHVVAVLFERYGFRVSRARDAYHDTERLVRSLIRRPDGLRALYETLRGIEQDSWPLRRLAQLI
jgi:nucleoside phosphorylase